jgi:hypothetical protein
MAYAPGYYVVATIDHTKCAASSQSGFPTAISMTLPGAHYPRSDGYDVHIFSDSGLTTRLAAERESYNDSTKVWIGWINLTCPASSGSDLLVYVAYGDANETTDPNGVATYGATSVWDANFKGVWHLNETGTVTTWYDSTGVNNGTSSANKPTPTTGKVNGGALFYHADANSIDVGINTSLQVQSLTISAWLNPEIMSGPKTFWGSYAYHTESSCFRIAYPSLNLELLKQGVAVIGTSTGTIPNGSWTLAQVTYDSYGNYIFYINGSSSGSGTNLVTFLYTANLGISIGWGGEGYNGIIDEVRISNSVRPADWIFDEYANQSDITCSGNFWKTLGSETAVGGGATVYPVWHGSESGIATGIGSGVN